MKLVAFRAAGSSTHHLAIPVDMCKPYAKAARSAHAMCGQEFGPTDGTRVSLDVGESRRCITCSSMAGKSVRLMQPSEMRRLENRWNSDLAVFRQVAS